jgi:hypothetical protein
MVWKVIMPLIALPAFLLALSADPLVPFLPLDINAGKHVATK